MKTEICPTCSGDGELATSHKFRCYDCDGTGKVSKEKYPALLEKAKETQRTLDRSVSISEYRQMGG